MTDKETKELTDEELISRLLKKYSPPAIPPCRVCRGELSVCAMNYATTEYACTGIIYDPIADEFVGYKEDRSPADEHYSKSGYIDWNGGGDEDVIELIERFKK